LGEWRVGEGQEKHRNFAQKKKKKRLKLFGFGIGSPHGSFRRKVHRKLFSNGGNVGIVRVTAPASAEERV